MASLEGLENAVPETVPGIHHVTAITGDAQRNVDFYVGVLGLRFVKKTVNFDVPDTYHLYYGDWLGTPGTEVPPTIRLLRDTVGFRQAGREDGRTRFETGAGGPGALVDVLEAPDGPRGEEAAGTVHHVAWRATDDGQQLAWRDVLVEVGRNVTPVIDRKYFRSIYFRESGGVLFEIATDQPGFTVDEAPEALGSALQLPPQYEGRREKLNFNLPPIVVPTTATSRAER
jgi:glyoxalase family protein